MENLFFTNMIVLCIYIIEARGPWNVTRHKFANS